MKRTATSFLLICWMLSSIAWGGDATSKERRSEKITVKATDARVKTDFEVQKGEWLELEIKGKWRMWDQWEYTGGLGHSVLKTKTGNLGALVLQIGDGRPFSLVDNLPFQAPTSGKVSLWPNREGGYDTLKADGALTIVIHTADALKDKRNKALGAAKEAYGKLLADPEVKKALAAINQARKACGLKEVALSLELSVGCRKHARYLAANEGHPLVQGLRAHEENEKLEGYSKEGARVAKKSIIHFAAPSRAIDGWMATFYHRMPLLQPKLKEVGIGYFSEEARHVCCVDCITGLTGEDVKDVVVYPGEGQRGVPVSFGPEIPNPLPAEHKGAAGFPITIYFTRKQKITNVEVKVLGPNDANVSCFVSTPESPATSFFQWNTLCAIPKQSFATGTPYQVELSCKVNGKPYSRSWRFTTAK
jgi:hypothetical protein